MGVWWSLPESGWWPMRTSTRLAALVAGAVISLTSSVPAQPLTTESPVSSYQSNNRHSGYAPTTFAPPLTLSWSRAVKEPQYPVVASGRLFISHYVGSSHVTAYSLSSGRRLWYRALGERALLGYGSGRLFAVLGNCIVLALDPATGVTLWARKFWEHASCEAPPVVAAGNVYVHNSRSSNHLFALDVTDGELQWSKSVGPVASVAPAVTADAIYVAGSVDTWAFRHDGRLIWHKECCGLNVGTPSLYRGRLYLLDGEVLDLATGNQVGTLASEAPLAFADGTAFRILDGKLDAVDLATGSVKWSFTSPAKIMAPPLVVGSYVYVGDYDGNLTGLRRSDGHPTWFDTTGRYLNSGDGSLSFGGFGAAEHRLIAPSHGSLRVYEPN